ncbi:hypothetical protein PTKIN_Ptkin13bG0034600 [Pterospermum kingtungense]
MAAAPSTEEMDLLERSTKKSKTTSLSEDFDSVDVVMETIPSSRLAAATETMGVGVSRPFPSFKDTLMGDKGKGSKSGLWDDGGLVSDDDEEVNVEEEDEECPTIRLTKEEKIRLRQPWGQTLIVKVLGRSVGYNTLLRRILALWRPKSKIEMVAIENDYFLVKFESSEDYHYAKFEGPWMVMEHYLIVQEWTPNFDPLTNHTERVLVWVRFPCLPIEYYDKEFLMRVGTYIGRPVRVDQATSLVSRGKFARMCVEVDITKPLLSKFKLRRRVRRIEYEGIHLVCFHCGIYGHRTESCLGKINCDNDVNRGEIHQPDQEVEINPEIIEAFGPWMLASRKPRRGERKQSGQGTSGHRGLLKGNNSLKGEVARGSKFTALEMLNNEEGIDVRRHEEDEDVNVVVPRLDGRGKRRDVQIFEKEVVNMEKGSCMEGVALLKKPGNLEAKVVKSRNVNRAAAAEEHVVVIGSQHGTVIERRVVTQGDNEVEAAVAMECSTNEHHQDPPRVARRGDMMIMDIEGDSEKHGNVLVGSSQGVPSLEER